MSGNRRAKIAETLNLSVIATCSSMMSFRHNLIINDKNRSDYGVRASLTERLLCFLECHAHELFVSSSIHRFNINSWCHLSRQWGCRRMLALADLSDHQCDVHRQSTIRADACLEGFEPPTF
jgi:hypothetical protein